MSITYIPLALRRSVRERAGMCCEYCRIHEDETEFECEVDHIISEKHSGRTEFENLALSCFFCNRSKGSDIGSVLSGDQNTFIRFFNPRIDDWSDHFTVDINYRVLAISDIGLVTSRIFAFNAENRILERQALHQFSFHKEKRAQS